MALPKAVQQQIDQANAIIDQLHKKDDKPEETKPAEQPEQPNLTVVENQPEQPAAEAPPAQPEPQKPEAKAEPQKPAEDFEHKYKVLKGKYDAEVPRLSRQIAELNGQLEGMREMIASMQKPTPAAAASSSTDLTPDISAEEIDEYGEELIELIGKKAKQVAKGEIDRLNSQIEDLKKQLGGVSQTVVENARDKMLGQLTDEVANWQMINRQPEFLDWLDRVDPYSGSVRGVMLRQAYAANDAPRVIAFFKGFLQEHAAITSPATMDSTEMNGGTPTVDLNEQVAPGRTKRSTGVVGAQKEKRIWTQAQIADFYKQVQMGKYRNKDAEKHRIEADIVAAAREGRIR